MRPILAIIIVVRHFRQYYELYKLTSKLLKAYDPGIKVGGPATARYEPPHPAAAFLERFLAHCRAHDCPLDFVSWHKYTVDPRVIEAHAREVRSLLDRYGYGGVESHLNEWNYGPGNWDIWGPGKELARRNAFELQKSEVGAAFVAATLMLLQDAGVDVRPTTMGSRWRFLRLFDYYGVPQKPFTRCGPSASFLIPESCSRGAHRRRRHRPELSGGCRPVHRRDRGPAEPLWRRARAGRRVRFDGLARQSDLTYSVMLVDGEVRPTPRSERGYMGHGVSTSYPSRPARRRAGHGNGRAFGHRPS